MVTGAQTSKYKRQLLDELTPSIFQDSSRTLSLNVQTKDLPAHPAPVQQKPRKSITYIIRLLSGTFKWILTNKSTSIDIVFNQSLLSPSIPADKHWCICEAGKLFLLTTSVVSALIVMEYFHFSVLKLGFYGQTIIRKCIST